MFNDDDMDKLADSGMRVPDGVFDASVYAQILSDMFDYIKEMDSDDFSSNIHFMMRCVNLAYDFVDGKTPEFSKDRAEDTITALSYFVMQMYANLDPKVKEEFLHHHENEVIPDTFSECKALPVYDLSDEVDSIFEVTDFDGMEEEND